MFSFNKLGASVIGHLGLLDVYSAVRRVVTRSQVAIIMYHRVSLECPPWLTGAVKPEDFEKEIDYLCKVARIVPLDWLVNQLYEGKSIPLRAVCLTFDDGYKDNYTFAYPVLRKYNVPATIFLTSSYIGIPDLPPYFKARFAIWNTDVKRFKIDGLGHYNLNSPNDRLQAMESITMGLKKLVKRAGFLAIEKLLQVLCVDIPDNLGENLMLSWDEVLEMSRNEISFGVHTVTHPLLTRLPIEEVRWEITRSKEDIEEKLGKPCVLFAYPNGDFNAEIVQLVEESGFTGAVTTIPKLLTRDANLLTLPRVSAGPTYYTLKGSFSGLYPDLYPIISMISRR